MTDFRSALATEAPPPVRLDALRADAARLDRTLRWRDARELLAVAVGVMFFSGVAALQPEVRGAALGLVAVSLWIGAVLVGVRLRWPRAGVGAPLAEALRAERDAFAAQAALLRWAWAWYVTPIAVGVAVFDGADGTSSPIYLSIVAGGSVLLSWANWRAADDLAAQRAAAAALLDDLADDA